MTDSFDAALEVGEDGIWHYVHVPKEPRDKYKAREHRGIIKVRATIGNSTWDASLMPWADGSAQISVNKKVRTAEAIQVRDVVRVSVELHD